MARTKKIVPETENANVESAVEEVVKEEKPKKKSRATINKELKAKAKDIDVEIENVTNANIFLKEKRSGEIIDLQETGDRAIISLDTLINLKNQYRDIFESLAVVLVDIYNNSYTKEDVLNLIGINDFYEIKDLSLEKIDELILDTTITNLEKKFNGFKTNNIKDKIVERSVVLRKEQKLTDTSRLKVFQDYYGTEDLYKNI